MGGRGGSSGIVAGGGVSYASEDHTLINEEALPVQWNGRYTGFVMSAITDEKGNLTLKNAKPEEFIEQTRKYAIAKTTLKHGVTLTDETGEYIAPRSVGINWDSVKTVSGKTYDVKEFIKSKGFSWNRDTQRWERNN